MRSDRATTDGTTSNSDRRCCCQASPCARDATQEMSSHPGRLSAVTTSYDTPFGIVTVMKCWPGGMWPLPRTSFSSMAVE